MGYELITRFYKTVIDHNKLVSTPKLFSKEQNNPIRDQNSSHRTRFLFRASRVTLAPAPVALVYKQAAPYKNPKYDTHVSVVFRTRRFIS